MSDLSDLISRSALKERWTIASPEPYTTDAAEVLASIDEAPAVDAVVPVRCKDCDHCLINLKWNTALCMRNVRRERVPLDGFCNFGEPRGGK